MNEDTDWTVIFIGGCFLGIIVVFMYMHYGNYTDTFTAIGHFIGCIAIGFVLLMMLTVTGKAFSKCERGLSFVERLEAKFKNLDKSYDSIDASIDRLERNLSQTQKIVIAVHESVCEKPKDKPDVAAIKAFEAVN